MTCMCQLSTKMKGVQRLEAKDRTNKIREVERMMKEEMRAVQRESEEAIYLKLPSIAISFFAYQKQTKEYIASLVPQLDERFYSLIRVPAKHTKPKKDEVVQSVLINEAFPIMTNPDIVSNPVLLFPAEEILELEQNLEAQCRDLATALRSIKRWMAVLGAADNLTVMAEEAIGISMEVIETIDTSAMSLRNLFVDYHAKRSRAVCNFQKHGSLDYFQLLVLTDKQMFLSISNFVEEMYDIVCMCYEILDQNFDKFINPRVSVDRGYH
ncbi:Hypothetical protein GSB_12062 [Giardia duodenalis]|uniref:Proteasome activator PA28 C-terminal domain-containing protein n=3 Tax=Giardia intestinalis TaxID=5741 RepID=C6LV19_GIAIB|nr:Hypothetical protein GL50581_2621 [Giardia intestinalis ATCC 50581]ESU42024.1 Hypothetical protein GSB_12062 [Giardia intestinalis]